MLLELIFTEEALFVQGFSGALSGRKRFTMDKKIHFQSCYREYKLNTSRLVYLLVTSCSAIPRSKTAASFRIKTDQGGKLSTSQFVPAAQLIAQQSKGPHIDTLRLLKSVIWLRSCLHEEFRRRVSSNPNFLVEKSNQSHKHFIDVLSQTFQILGGDEVLQTDKRTCCDKTIPHDHHHHHDADVSENVFCHLHIDETGAESGSDDDRHDTAELRPSGLRRRAKQRSTRKKSQRHKLDQKLSLNKYGITMDDGHLAAADHFLAAATILEQCIDLRFSCQTMWLSDHIIAASRAAHAISMINQTQTSIFADFPDGDSYLDLLQVYTGGGTHKLQDHTTVRLWHQANREQQDQGSCRLLKEVFVEREPMRELLMEHAYNDLVAFVRDFQKTLSGRPTKAMQSRIRKWDGQLNLKLADDAQRIQWRQVYTVNWLYWLLGSYSAHLERLREDEDLAEDDYPGAKTPAKGWEEDFTFFGLGDFSRKVMALTQQTDSCRLDKAISPCLVFQLQCIVDSFVVSCGWTVKCQGHVVSKEKPVNDANALDKLCTFCCGDGCTNHEGLNRTMKSFDDLASHAFSSSSPSFLVLMATWELFMDNFVQHHRIMLTVDCDDDPGQYMPKTPAWELNEDGLWGLSPFLCSFTLIQAMELSYRFALALWDWFPEIRMVVHLYSMLRQTGRLKEPIGVIEDLKTWFTVDFFGEHGLPSSRFGRRCHQMCQRRPLKPDRLDPFLINSSHFKPFHMADERHKTRSGLLVFHEAAWLPENITAPRLASLCNNTTFKRTFERLSRRACNTLESRKHFTSKPKNGDIVAAPHFNENATNIAEPTILALASSVLYDDVSGETPLSGTNLLGVTAKLLSVWIAVAEILKASFDIRTKRDETIYSALYTAMNGEDDDLLEALASTFDQHRDEQSYRFFL